MKWRMTYSPESAAIEERAGRDPKFLYTPTPEVKARAMGTNSFRVESAPEGKERSEEDAAGSGEGRTGS